MSLRRQLRAATSAMDVATTYAAWSAAAAEHDSLSGADDWRRDDDSPHYDAASLRASIERLRSAREARDGIELASALTEDLYRHLNDFSAPGLYEHALHGTKRLIDLYLEESATCMRWLADHDVPGLSSEAKRLRFETASKVFGRSALLLSGGGTWGFHHLGVVKALLELGLLPQILSGASTGAMIAAAVCARSDDELRAMYADTGTIRLDGLVPIGVQETLRTQAWLDPEKLDEVLRHNCGEHTFAEAHARSGRVLNISVSPTRSRQKPRLLTHLTAPDVLIARAAVASSALPGLFPPVVLHKRGPDGRVVDYIPEERWVDGSLYGDLPKQRLSRLHNVNHFIVSQANPMVLPFVHQNGRRGVRATMTGLASATVRAQGGFAADLARRAQAPGPFVEQAYALLNQDYRGDIDIHPRFHWANYRKVASNPTRKELSAFILEGQRAVWPQVAKITNQTRLARAFRACIATLRAAQRD